MSKIEKWYVITGIAAVILFILLLCCVILCGINIEAGDDAMIEVLKDIGVSLISSLIVSIVTNLILYFKFLKKIPHMTEENVHKVLTERLNHESINHNATLQTIDSKTLQLSGQHKDIQKDIQNVLIQMKEKEIKEIERYSGMSNEQKDILKNVEAMKAITDEFLRQRDLVVSQQGTIREMQRYISALEQQLRNQEQGSTFVPKM